MSFSALPSEDLPERVVARAELGLPAANRRSWQRRIVNVAAALKDANVVTSDVAVIDLAEGGCRIRPNDPIEIGQIVWLKFAGFEMRRAEVAWAEGGDVGCTFAIPLHRSDIEAIRSSFRKPVRKNAFG